MSTAGPLSLRPGTRRVLTWFALPVLLLISAIAVPLPERVRAAQLGPFDQCERIADLESPVLAGFETRLAAFRARLAAALEGQAVRWAEQDTHRAAELGAAKRRLSEQLARLDATTDAQREAIDAFRAAVEGSLQRRHAANDAAIQEYRAGVTAALDARLAETIELFAMQTQAVMGHLAKARSDCAGGVPPRTVLAALQASLAAARAELDAALAAHRSSLQARLAPLHEALRSAIQQSQSTFRAEVEAAGVALKAAFGR